MIHRVTFGASVANDVSPSLLRTLRSRTAGGPRIGQTAPAVFRRQAGRGFLRCPRFISTDGSSDTSTLSVLSPVGRSSLPGGHRRERQGSWGRPKTTQWRAALNATRRQADAARAARAVAERVVVARFGRW